MALNTVELSSFITKGLGLAQPFHIQAGTSGCFFCSLEAFHGKYLDKSKLFIHATLWDWLSLAVRSSSHPAFHQHVLDGRFQPLGVDLNAQISAGRAQGCFHPLCPYRTWPDTPSSPNPSLCPQAGGFSLKPCELFRCCLTMTEFIDCTSLQSSPGMISSCIELSGAKNDTSVD